MAAWRKTKTVRIPTKWYALLPGQPLTFWVRVAAAAKRKGVAKKDLEGIKRVALALFNE